MLPEQTLKDAESLLAACRAKKIVLAAAESCTGGLIAAALTAPAGASDVFDCGFVTYSNDAKQRMLGIPLASIEDHGAVSEVVARAMADGALVRSRAGIAISVTGRAGPGGGSADKPVGTVCVGLARTGAPTRSETRVFVGDRTAIRIATVTHALTMIEATIRPPLAQTAQGWHHAGDAEQS